MLNKIRTHETCNDSKMCLWKVQAQKIKYFSLFWLFGQKYMLLLNPALPAIIQGSCKDRFSNLSLLGGDMEGEGGEERLRSYLTKSYVFESWKCEDLLYRLAAVNFSLKPVSRDSYLQSVFCEQDLEKDSSWSV